MAQRKDGVEYGCTETDSSSQFVTSAGAEHASLRRRPGPIQTATNIMRLPAFTVVRSLLCRVHQGGDRCFIPQATRTVAAVVVRSARREAQVGLASQHVSQQENSA